MKSPAGKKTFAPTWLALVALALGGTYSGCSTPPLVDSNTNWLVMCNATAECGSALACVCGVCTESCSASTTCAERGGVCVEPDTLNGEACASQGAGGGSQSRGAAICLPECTADSECESSWTCVQGACIEPPSIELPLLTWPPPVLETPETLTLTGSPAPLILDAQRDYILEAAAPLTGPLRIEGGRNVMVSGIEIAVDEFEDETRRLLSLEGMEGIVHVEGVSLRGPNALTGFFINSPGAVVQIQNVRIEGVSAASEEESGTVEPALLRAEAAVEIRVDGFSGSSRHHGLFFSPSSADALGAIRLQRVDLRNDGESGTAFHMEEADAYTLIDCFVQLSATRAGDLCSALAPDQDAPAPATCEVRENSEGQEIASWPDIVAPPLDGTVARGLPPSGTFVPAGLIGLHYTAPGYQ